MRIRSTCSSILCALVMGGWGVCLAQGTIQGTRHDLSIDGSGAVQATAETQVCVFCHAPHGAQNFPGSPLWNRSRSNETYTPFTSSSLDAEAIAGTQLASPGGTSKLCLSCHDGTLALGAVSNAPGSGLGGDIGLTGTSVTGGMPAGSGTDTGFTRNLGTDLTNDHPISVTYDSVLVGRDGELVSPSAAHIGAKSDDPLLPLEATGSGGALQVQCGTCHDPHLPDFGKFLRTHRLQQNDPIGTFAQAGDQICLGCHDKSGWEDSAHAVSSVADEQYASVGLREFPPGTSVAEAGCLNCHDAHTVHGARRLLREGTDSLATPKSGGDSAIEESCFQCHTSDASTVLSTAGNQVPDIETEFNLLRHMPLTTSDQLASTEVHDIGTGQNFDEGDRRGSDLIEDESLLGKGNPNNRHAECTDCHNPHRVLRNSRYDGSGSPSSATHEHSTGHSNEASGALAGAWGVEPNYGSSAFLALPSSYTIKRGDPQAGGTDVVSKEYQICLKCHSDYGYDDNGSYALGGDTSGRPSVGASGGSTAPGTNDLTTYTNQAMEFQAPLGDRGEPGNVNHRSWHPVIDITARDKAARGNMDSNMFLSPWDSTVGALTMYCSDCHGRETANGTSAPPAGRPWGPHGSNADFILKGDWNANTGGGQTDDLCFKCHNYDAYADPDLTANFQSGFQTGRGNGHHVHNSRDRLDVQIRCSWCHVAVPHGWKNKALLVDLNDVGPEAGQPAGTTIPDGQLPYTQGPYYLNSVLKVRNWRQSGTWRVEDCGNSSGSFGDEWMKDVCEPAVDPGAR